MIPSLNSGQNTFIDAQQFIPQNGTVNVPANKLAVNTTSIAIGARFKF
jgi:hypothetical protein